MKVILLLQSRSCREITATSDNLSSLPLTVAQIFNSFELIVAPEVAQLAAAAAAQQDKQEEQAAGQTGGTAEVGDNSCHPSYPDVCIPPPPPNLNCDDVSASNFEVVGSDPHGFDGDNDGIGCEDGNGEDDVDDDDGGEDNSCHPSYPDVCIPPPPPNLNCDDVSASNFEVVGSDPHGFDGDNDGIGCEDGGGGGDDDDADDEDDDDGGEGGEGGEGEGGEGGEGEGGEGGEGEGGEGGEGEGGEGGEGEGGEGGEGEGGEGGEGEGGEGGEGDQPA